jgi:hypothetical protein
MTLTKFGNINSTDSTTVIYQSAVSTSGATADNVITTTGDKNLDKTLTTTQTAFTLDQELITKKLFDDNPKTQNITSDTDTVKTTFKKNVIVGEDTIKADGSQLAILSYTGTTITTTITVCGFRFKTPAIKIDAILFKVSNWVSANTTKEYKIYNEIGDKELYKFNLNKNNNIGGFYFFYPPTEVILPAGSYIIAVELEVGVDKIINYSSASSKFNSIFSDSQGVFNDPAQLGEILKPNKSVNFTASSFIFTEVPTTTSKGNIECQSALRSKDAFLGYKYPEFNYIVKEIMTGAALDGNPSATGEVLYTQGLLTLGANTANDLTGQISYTSLNLNTRSLEMSMLVSLSNWESDGGIFGFAWGLYEFIYFNNKTAGTSRFEIKYNNVVLHTETLQIPALTSTAINTFTVHYEKDTQNIIYKGNDGIIPFRFIDAIPRNNTTNTFRVFGGALGGTNGVVKLTKLLLSHTPDENATLFINPDEVKCNSLMTSENYLSRGNIEEDMRGDNSQGVLVGATYTKNSGFRLTGGSITYPTFDINAGCEISMDFQINSGGAGNSLSLNFGEVGPSKYRNYYILFYLPNIFGSNNFSLSQNINGVSTTLLDKEIARMNNLTFSYTGSGIILYADGVEQYNAPSTPIFIHSGFKINGSSSIDMDITKVSLKKTSTSIVPDLTYVDNKFKNTVFLTEPIGITYDMSMICTDETTAISATGNKLFFYIPRDLKINAIKVSLTVGGGVGFAITVFKNGFSSQVISQDNNLITTTAVDLDYATDDLISINVNDIGNGNGKGLKIILLGITKNI